LTEFGFAEMDEGKEKVRISKEAKNFLAQADK